MRLKMYYIILQGTSEDFFSSSMGCNADFQQENNNWSVALADKTTLPNTSKCSVLTPNTKVISHLFLL